MYRNDKDLAHVSGIPKNNRKFRKQQDSLSNQFIFLERMAGVAANISKHSKIPFHRPWK